MKVKEIVSQSRRDFTAIYECEHCAHAHRGSGYDDSNFHVNVIPRMECPACKKTAADTYCPLATKYPEGFQV